MHTDSIAKMQMFAAEVEALSSPIERLMAGALMILVEPTYRPGIIRHDFCLESASLEVQEQVGPTIWAQAPIGRYRIDFLVRWKLGDISYFYAVECDGHDYHSRTKAQIERDKERDNSLLALDIPTFRYAGSSIVRDPYGVATDVIEKTGALALRRFFAAQGFPDAGIGLEFKWGRRVDVCVAQ
jgi:very-short-patch-repair endonuclease